MNSNYHRFINRDKNNLSDIYDILRAYGITDPSHQHAIKKLLAPGQRGGKGLVQDVEEAICSLNCFLEHLKRADMPEHPVPLQDKTALASAVAAVEAKYANAQWEGPRMDGAFNVWTRMKRGQLFDVILWFTGDAYYCYEDCRKPEGDGWAGKLRLLTSDHKADSLTGAKAWFKS